MIAGIYAIESPSLAIYIGQSKDIEKRFKQYRKNDCKFQIRLYNSLKKYTPEKHSFKIIHPLSNNVSQEVIDSYEIEYIKLFKNNGFEVMNIREGGSKGAMAEESKLKLSISLKGVNTWTKGLMAGEKNPNYGKGCFGSKNGAYGKNRRHLCIKAAAANEKVVYKINSSGDILSEYKSATIAAKENNLKIANISACCLNKKGYNTAGGFVWKYKPTTP